MTFDTRLIRAAIAMVAVLAATGFSNEPAPFEDCQLCQDSGLPSAGTHKFASPGAFLTCAPNTCHAQPLDGMCATYHGQCQEQFLDAQQDLGIIETAVVGSPAGVAQMLKRYRGAVRYNSARRALQVYDCGGHVTAHLPVSEALAVALSD